MAEFTDKYNLDAKNYVTNLAALKAEQEKHGRTVSAITGLLTRHAEAMGNVSIKVKDVAGNNRILNSTIKHTEEGFKAVRSTLIEVETHYAKLIRLQKEAMVTGRAERQVTAELARVRKQLLTEDQKAERQGRAEALKAQRALMAQILDMQKKLNQYEKERKAVLDGQLAVTKAMTEARARAVQLAAQEARLQRQQQLGSGLGARLQTRFIDPFKTLADPANLARIQAHINKIVAAVKSGALKASEAQRIISSALAGQPQVLTGAGQRVQAAAAGISAALKRITDGAYNAKKGLKDMGEEGGRSAQRLLLTMQSLMRLLTVQLLHTAISAFIGQLRQAIDGAKEFSIKIGEIQTISLRAGLSFDQWANSVRRLSDEFGNPINDVAEGTYEAISNQVARGAEATRFMSKALEFARVTVSSTADSVNLLSSVMNAYHKNVDDVERISAVFFKTIDLGRVRASDLANTFGRIAPLGATLGITYQELAAAIATLTIQGIKPAETLTAINAVMTKLLRPTEAMNDLLRDWGVNSGQAAIATFGFAGTLRKLIEASEQGKAEMSDLFNEVRATRGITGLIRAVDNFDSVLAQINQGSLADLKAALDLQKNNVGVRFQVELTKIKNFFTNDFGQGIIETLVGFGTSVDATTGKTTGFVDVLRQLLSAGRVLVGTFIAFKVATKAWTAALAVHNAYLAFLSIEMKIAGVSAATLTTRMSALRSMMLSMKLVTFGPAILALGAFAIFTIFENIAEKAREIESIYDNINDNAIQRAEEQTKELAAQLDKQKEDFAKSLNKRFASFAAYTNALSKASVRLGKVQEAILEQTTKNLKNSFDLFVDAAQKQINDLEQVSRTALDNIQGAAQKIQEIKDGLITGRFEAQLKLQPPVQQIKTLEREIARLTALGQQILSEPGDAATLAANLKRSETIFARRDKLQNDILERRAAAERRILEIEKEQEESAQRQNADTTVEERQEAAAELLRQQQRQNADDRAGSSRRSRQNARETQQQREQRETSRQAIAAAREAEETRRQTHGAVDRQAELAVEKAIVAEIGTEEDIRLRITAALEQQILIYEDFVTRNEALEVQAAAKAEEERARLETLKDTFAEVAKFKLPDEINLSNFTETQKSIQDAFTKALSATRDESIIKQLIEQRTQLEEEAERKLNDFRIKQFQETLNKQKEDLVKQHADVTAAILAEDQKRRVMIESIKGTIELLDKLQDEKRVPVDLGGDKFSGPTLSFGEIIQKLLAITEVIGTASASGDQKAANQAQRDFAKLFTPLLSFLQDDASLMAKGLEEFGIKSSIFPEQVKTLKDVVLFLQKQLFNLGSTPQVQANLAKQQAEFAAKLAAIPTLQANIDATKISLGGLAAATEKLAAQFRSFGFLPPPAQKAQGGPIWQSRGTDRVPAMLTPGEFVVNAASTQKYWRELMQINSGKPMYRQSGGVIPYVTGVNSIGDFRLGSNGDTINVGDINITNQSSGDAKVDAKALAYEIKREIRRGRV